MFMTIVLVLTLVSSLGLTWLLQGFQSWNFLWELPVFLLVFYYLYVVITVLILYAYCRRKEDLNAEPREEPSLRRLIYHVVDFAFSVLRVKFHVTGLEKIPQDGRMVVVCNHIHILDPLAIHKVFKKQQLAFISKQENNKLPLVNRLMHGTNCQMLNRENDREALTVILKCIDLLKKDAASIGVFPEGYTSMNGHLQPFRNGVFKIAQRAKVPIVVCTIQGTSKVFRNYLRRPINHVTVDILDVISAEDLQGTTKDLGDRIHVIMENNLGFWGTPMLEGARKVAKKRD